MAKLMFCRICLVTDVRMYSLDVESGDSLGLIYSQTTGIKICGTCQHVCYECVSLLKKTNSFLLKCHRAHKILSAISENTTTLTKRMIQKIDRKENKLESNLKFSEISCYEPGKDVISKYSTTLNNILNTEGNNKFDIEIKREEYSDGIGDNITVDSLDLHEKYVETESLDSNIKEYKPKSINIIYGNFNTEIQSTLDLIKTSLDDFDNDTIEYLDENILAEVEESVTLTSKAVKKPNIIQVATHKSKVQKPNNIQDDLKTNILKKRLYNHEIYSITKVDWSQEFEGYGTVISMTPEDARKDVLERQNSKNYKTSQYKCDICYRGYGIKCTYDNHMKGHNLETGYYECDICHFRFCDRTRLRAHFTRCHLRKFICKLCTFTTYDMKCAKSHVSHHKGKTYKCNYCEESFSVPNTLDSHKRLKHLNDSVAEFFCDICGNVFATRNGIAVHKFKLHKSDKNSFEGPKCEECGIHFDSEKAWSRHLVLSSKHTKILSQYNTCKHCGESFTDVTELRSHIYNNHVFRNKVTKHYVGPRKLTKPDTCKLCNESVSNWDELDIHMRKVHPNQRTYRRRTIYEKNNESFVCEKCGLACKFQRQLIEHQRSHTGERPFKCNDCDKRYTTKTALYSHSKTHDNVKHVCNMCGRVLASKGALDKHIRLHKGIRPFKCSICDKAFPHKCELKQHVKYVHEKVPWPKRIRRKRNVTNKLIASSE